MVILIFIAAFALIGSLAAVAIVFERKQRQLPVTHVQAEVMSLRSEDIFVMAGEVMIPMEEHAAVFVTQDGRPLEFDICEEVYHYLREGDRGDLVFQGRRYLDFVREQQRRDSCV